MHSSGNPECVPLKLHFTSIHQNDDDKAVLHSMCFKIYFGNKLSIFINFPVVNIVTDAGYAVIRWPGL